MDIFPQAIVDIIRDYKSQLEHVEKFQPSLEEIPQMYHVIKKIRLHNEFRMFFYPGLLDSIFWDLPLPDEEPPSNSMILHRL